MQKTFITLFGVLALLQAGCTRSSTPADTVLMNGRIYTVDEANPWAEAVAVRGTDIVYVGDSSGAQALVGNGTEVVDLGGRMMLPGFVEDHFHVTAPAIMLKGVDLQTETLDELYATLRTYVEQNPQLDQIHGWGVRPNLFPNGWPTAADLDAIEADRPVFLWLVDGHASWANSEALQAAGITKETPDTIPGFAYFIRDGAGNPTGFLWEVPAQLQVLSKLVAINYDYVNDGVGEWLPRYSAAGITTVHDYGIQGVSVEDGVKILTDYEASGQLPIRFYGSYYWNDASVDPVPITERLKAEYNTDLVKFISLKINMDGDDAKYNGLYVEPYADRPDLVAEPIIPRDVVNDAVQRADAAHLNVTCHCFGDLAVRILLDAVEAAKEANPPWDRRHVASHAQLVHPDDFGRFAELGVTYSTTGQWMGWDPILTTVSIPRLGKERVDHAYPMKAVADAGGNVSLGSDFPAASYFADYQPLNAIQMATTRQVLGKPDAPLLGGEAARVPLDLAIRANTLGAAWGMNVDDVIGSIEIGKKADLIVLDRNLFEIDPHTISETKVQLTMMNGIIRHREGM